MKVEPYCLLVKIFEKDNMGWTILSFGQILLKRQHGFNHVVFWSELSKKTIWVELSCHLVKTFKKDNVGWTILCFGQNFQKRTIWVELSCHLVETFKKDNVGWTILPFGQNFRKIHCDLNYIVFRSKLSKKNNTS